MMPNTQWSLVTKGIRHHMDRSNEYSTNAARPTFMNYYCVKLIDTIYFDMALIDVIIGRAAPESIEVLWMLGILYVGADESGFELCTDAPPLNILWCLRK